MSQSDPTQPGRDLRAVPDNDDPRAVAEAILFEVRRVIVGQDADARAHPRRAAVRWPHPPGGCPGARQDPDDQDPGRCARRIVQARPVHPGPDAVGPRRDAHLSPVRRHVRDGARSRLRELPARRRDQPGAGQGPVGPPRGHAGAAGHDRRRHACRPGTVHRPRDGEPDRSRRDLPAARGPGRPVHAQDRPGLPVGRPRKRRSSPARCVPDCRRARSWMPTGWPRSSGASTTSTWIRGSSATPWAWSRRPAASSTGARRSWPRTSAMARARAARSTSSPAPAPSRCCAAVATRSRPMSRSWRPMSCATGSCCRMRH